jgi:hypothetical protein
MTDDRHLEIARRSTIEHTKLARLSRQTTAFLFSIVFAVLGICVAVTQAAADPFAVSKFSSWAGYAIPNGQWLTGDLNGDGKTDIVHVVQNTDYVNVWLSKGDGTFTVKSFRPWPGYGMNGVWLTGDFSGDHRTDLVHVVPGADYVNVWTSRGDGTFTVQPFRPWAGYAMPNGVWLAADFNGDGKTDIVHVVQNADYVNVWTSNGNGTFSVTPFRPWAGYAMPNGVWLAADFNGDGKADLVHVVQNTDYVNVWTSKGNSTFDVKPFRPWAGYAMPNGVWLAADFNGDGKADLVHVVQNADYVNVWTSKANATFDVKSFRPWPGYAMPNGLWLVGDYDKDGKADIVHAVQGADYVNIWRSRGDGTFKVTSFSPWAGYAIPNGLWLTGDFNGDGKADIVHAVQNTDYVHPWLSTLPALGEFAVDALEVTQAVQDMSHSVPLVSNKDTIVRAYLSANIPAPSGPVTGTLFAWRPFPAPGVVRMIPSLASTTVDPAKNDMLGPKRDSAAASLNFRVPADLLGSGPVLFRLASISPPVACASCGATTRFVSFSDSGPVRVRVLGLSYTTGTPAQSYAPRALDFQLIKSWLTRAYPTAQVSMSQLTINASHAWPMTCNDANAQLAGIRALDVNSGTDHRTHYFGLVADGGGFMRGCAAGIPQSPDPSTVASGPTGTGTWGWDTDGSYGDWYTGHELGHTYGRFHIGSGCGESADDPSYPFPHGQLANPDDAFVGFDVGDPAHSIPLSALPGPQWHDVMSYCVTQWLSSYTYAHIHDRLVAENGMAAGPAPPGAGPTPPMAGAAPATGAMLVPAMSAAPAATSGAPLTPAVISATRVITTPALAGPPASVTPAQTAPVEIVTELASPAPVRRGSKTLEGVGSMAAVAVPLTAAAKPLFLDQPPAEMALAAATLRAAQSLPTATAVAQAATPAPAAPAAEAKTGDFLHVVAQINITRGTGKLTHTNRVQQALVSQSGTANHASLRFLGSGGSVVGEQAVPVRTDTDPEPNQDVLGLVDVAVPFPSGTTAVELLLNGKVVDRLNAGSPEAAAAAAQPSADSAVSASRSGDQVVVKLPTGGPANLGFNVQVSPDDGKTWHTIAVGAKGDSVTVDASQFKGANQLKVQVTATDGLNTRALGLQTVPLTTP